MALSPPHVCGVTVSPSPHVCVTGGGGMAQVETKQHTAVGGHGVFFGVQRGSGGGRVSAITTT